MLEKRLGHRRGAEPIRGVHVRLVCSPKAFWSGWALRAKTNKAYLSPVSQDRPGQLPGPAGRRIRERPGTAVHIWSSCSNKLEKKRPQHKWPPNASCCLSLAANVKFHHLVFQINSHGEES